MIFDPTTLQKYRLCFLKLRAISGSSRFYILNIIRINQPINVSQIVEKSGLEQPVVSQLLSVLNKANFVQFESHGKENRYKINEKEIENIIQFSANFCVQKEKEKAELCDSYTQIFQTYQALKALLNPGRMILIEFMKKKGEMTVSELTEHAQTQQSIVSQHLSVLKNLNVIIYRSEGRNSIYKLNEDALNTNQKLVETHF